MCEGNLSAGGYTVSLLSFVAANMSIGLYPYAFETDAMGVPDGDFFVVVFIFVVGV